MAQNDEAALDVVRRTSVPIHDVGTAVYLSADVFGWAAEWGWTNPFSFYFAGRGGMLGDVSHDVVTSAFGWFEPDGGEGDVRRRRGRRRLHPGGGPHGRGALEVGTQALRRRRGLEDHVAVTEELVDGIEGAAIPLFVGWRNAARCETAAGRAAQLMQMLREWRGGLHLVSTTAVGLTPLEAILTNEGEGQAKFFGWAEPFPEIASIKAKHDEAEAMTDRLCAQTLAQALDESKFGAFEAAVSTLRAATP